MRYSRLLPILLFCSAGAPALAQAPGGAQDGAAPSIADARLATTIYGAYGSPILMENAAAVRSVAEAGADTDFFARRQGKRLDLQLAAVTGMRRFAAVDAANLWSHVTTASLTAPLTERTQFGLTAVGGYSQLLALDGVNTQGSVASAAGDQALALDSGIGRRPTAIFGGGAQLTRTLSTRSSVLLTYDVRDSRVVDGPRARTLDQNGQIAFANRFRQRALLRFAYGFRQAEFGLAGSPLDVIRQHSAIAGFDRQWVHSATRQSALRISAGPSLLTGGGGPSRYIVTADAMLDSQVSHSWVVAFGASRAMNFVDGIARPFLAHEVRGELRGRLGRRLDITLGGNSSTGVDRFTTTPASFHSRGGRARLTWDLSRAFGLFGEYVYRWYELTDALAGAAATTRADRGHIRAGLTWQLPLKGRLPADAAR